MRQLQDWSQPVRQQQGWCRRVWPPTVREEEMVGGRLQRSRLVTMEKHRILSGRYEVSEMAVQKEVGVQLFVS